MFTRQRCRAIAAGTATLLALGMATLPAATASAAVAPAVPASGPAASAASGPALQVVLKILGLSVQISDGHLAATGPGPVISAACAALGTDLKLGAIAFYDKPNKLGKAIIIFTGDNAPANASGKVTGDTIVNFQNCTNQDWSITNPAGTAIDASTTPGTDKDIKPTDATFADTKQLTGLLGGSGLYSF
jgi:hypothetical protein